MKKRRLFAPFLMLLAGAVTLAMMLHWNYQLVDILWVLLIVLIVFYIIGSIIQRRVNIFEEDNWKKEQEEAAKEGAVIEKEAKEQLDNNEDAGYNKRPPINGAVFEGMDFGNQEETSEDNQEQLFRSR